MEQRARKGGELWHTVAQLLAETSVMLTAVLIPSCPVLRIWVQEAHLTPPTFLLGSPEALPSDAALPSNHVQLFPDGCFNIIILYSFASATPSPPHLKVCKTCIMKWYRVKEYNSTILFTGQINLQF